MNGIEMVYNGMVLNLNDYHEWRQMYEMICMMCMNMNGVYELLKLNDISLKTVRKASLQRKGGTIPCLCSKSLPLHLLRSLVHNFIIHIMKTFVIIKKGKIVDSMP